MWFISFISGQAGILEVKNYNRIKELYELVGELSYCGLYFLPKHKAVEIVNAIRLNHWEFQVKKKIVDILQNESNFFTLNTVFDYFGGERDGEIYHIDLNFGDKLNDNIKQILKKMIK